MSTNLKNEIFKVSDSEDEDDVKIIPGTFATWDVVDQMNYIEKQMVLSDNLVKSGADIDDTIDVEG